MTNQQNWLLPDGIYEALPDEATHFESLRRELLDLYQCWGYSLVIPPMAEFMDSLSTGTGKKLDTQTFKVTDQITGRVMGIRADITPQVARLDAHQMQTSLPNRLCYAGPVLRAQGNHSNHCSRSPYQIGAELFGHAGLESDLEVISLALETLKVSEIKDVVLDLGHVGIFKAWTKQVNLSEEDKSLVSDMLIRKSIPDLEAWLASIEIPQPYADFLLQMPSMTGDVSVLQSVRALGEGLSEDISSILDYLDDLCSALVARFPEVSIHVDLAELRGYAYHTGMIFEIYTQGARREIMRGGRYDGIGEAFGNARPATGFSTDLSMLSRLSNRDSKSLKRVLAPSSGVDEDLQRFISDLRADGIVVIQQFNADEYNPEELGCSEIIVKNADGWAIQKAN